MRPARRRLKLPHILVTLALVAPAFSPAGATLGKANAAVTRGPAAISKDEAEIEQLLLPAPDIPRLQERGPAVLPIMARVYRRSDVAARAVIAGAFYRMGWRSAEAKRALMEDAHTSDPNLRLQVQWALGRVSNDTEVVDILLENMQHDGNPLFRDKAACALAHDQIHLTEGQKIHLYDRLIQALRDPKEQVRDIAIKVLVIHTGQNKGFEPSAPPGRREESIRVWEQWLEEYRANQ